MRRTISSYSRSFFSKKLQYFIRYAHSQTSSFETPGSLAKFTPLPNKWSTSDHVYTGRPAGTTSIAYYDNLLDSSTIPKRQSIYSEVIKALNIQLNDFPISYVGTQACGSADLQIGDIIETCNRHGRTEIGVILKTEDNKIEYITCESEKRTLIDTSSVVLVLKQVYQQSIIRRFLKNADNSSLFLWNLSLHLRLLVRDSLALSKKVSQKRLPAVLANVSRRAGWSAIDLKNAARMMHRTNGTRITKGVIQALSTYFSLCFSDLRVCRPTIETGFFCMSSTLYSAVNKVMNNTSQFEFEQCVNLIAAKIAGRETSCHALSLLAPFLIFFHHYILCADARLAPAVSTFLSKIYPDIDSDAWLTSPSSVHKMLVEAGLNDPSSPFLGNIYGLCYRDLSGSLTDDLEQDMINEYHSPVIDSTKDHTRHNLMPFTFQQAKDIAVSMEFDQGLDTFFAPNTNHEEEHVSGIIHVHLPDMSTLGEISSSLVQNIFRRSKSMELPQGILHLLPENIRQYFIFSETTQTSFTLSIPFTKEDDTFQFLWDECKTGVAELVSRKQLTIIDAREFDDPETFSVLPLELQIAHELLYSHLHERLQNDAVYDYSISSQAYSIPIHTYQYGGLHVIQEARILAGRIFGEYCAKNKIAVPYLIQDCKEGIVCSKESFDLLSIQRRIDGSISDKDLSQIKYKYLGLEHYTETPGHDHVGLGCMNYVDIGFPLDNAMHILAQYSFQSKNSSSPFSVYGGNISAQQAFIDWFRDKVIGFHKLNQLQNELLSTEEGYFIFRCVILGESKYPDLAKGYCRELKMNVDIAMLPRTMVHPGNTVVCTEILELNPVNAMLVVGL